MGMAKLRDYCLSPTHPHGRHKARVFASVLGLGPGDAPFLRQELLNAARSAEAISGEADELLPKLNELFCTIGVRCWMVDIRLLSVVALLVDLPERGLVQGQVGTVVETLASGVFEVEFSDEEGCTYASLALRAEQLMLLHHQPQRQAV